MAITAAQRAKVILSWPVKDLRDALTSNIEFLRKEWTPRMRILAMGGSPLMTIHFATFKRDYTPLFQGDPMPYVAHAYLFGMALFSAAIWVCAATSFASRSRSRASWMYMISGATLGVLLGLTLTQTFELRYQLDSMNTHGHLGLWLGYEVARIAGEEPESYSPEKENGKAVSAEDHNGEPSEEQESNAKGNMIFDPLRKLAPMAPVTILFLAWKSIKTWVTTCHPVAYQWCYCNWPTSLGRVLDQINKNDGQTTLALALLAAAIHWGYIPYWERLYSERRAFDALFGMLVALLFLADCSIISRAIAGQSAFVHCVMTLPIMAFGLAVGYLFSSDTPPTKVHSNAI